MSSKHTIGREGGPTCGGNGSTPANMQALDMLLPGRFEDNLFALVLARSCKRGWCSTYMNAQAGMCLCSAVLLRSYLESAGAGMHSGV